MVSPVPQGYSEEVNEGSGYGATRYNDHPATDHSTANTVPGLSSELVDFRVRWIHFVLGCTVLVPWNGIFLLSYLMRALTNGNVLSYRIVLITALPFFLSRLSGSPFQETFSSYLSITFLSADFIFLAHATATSKTVRYIPY
jgi:equilibrative nucleoside transporter 1/2/3